MIQYAVARLEEHFARDGSIERVFLAVEMTDEDLPGEVRHWERWLDPADVAFYASLTEEERGEAVQQIATRVGAEEFALWQDALSRRPPPPRRFTREEIESRVPVGGRFKRARPTRDEDES